MDDDFDDIDFDPEVPTGVKVAVVAGTIAIILGSRGKIKPGPARFILHKSAQTIGSFGLFTAARQGGHSGDANAAIPPHGSPLPPGPVPSTPPRPTSPLDISGQIAAAARAVVTRTYSRALSGAIGADPRQGIGVTRTRVATTVLTAHDRKVVGKAADDTNGVTNTIQNGFVDLVASSLPPDP